MTRRGALLGALALAACDEGPKVEPVSLPVAALRGTADPLWQAAEIASFALAMRPQNLEGKPAEAAFAVMLYEYAAAEAGNGRLHDQNPGRLMREGRPHLRAAAGLIGEAEPQRVIDALWSVTEALRRGDEAASRAAFSAPVFRGPPEVPRAALSRLVVPPQAVRGLRALREALARDQLSPR
ncbi:hypothetical protein KO353_02890 [Elioraea tepida]|uniref:Uncharacterized protein n=1 Tax=Elioraea tepida TaxID=2843330 RepID=A0A975U3B6_9PROT|nr:hypothetical protein [Elioraea tepida]QXM25212.1 hypothetical protein KO353_02890 [Elioraea tepida]